MLYFALWLAQKNSRHSLNQSDAKVKPTTTWSPAFSRALGSLIVSNLSIHWLLKLFSFHLIGRCDNFVLVLRPSIEKREVSFGFILDLALDCQNSSGCQEFYLCSVCFFVSLSARTQYTCEGRLSWWGLFLLIFLRV